ncbi:collectin-10-like [Branchiostoma lanceolatum]|uniref:collectin-10-like n=1 Tax=Branchiostoma lanceolatum TaxID=7740 RepID=UPI003453F516
MPKDHDTNAFLTALYTSVNDKSAFWFGLHDQREEGSFEWVDGSALGTYNTWRRGQPRSGHCAVYYGIWSQWHAWSCNQKRPFICQVAPEPCGFAGSQDGEKGARGPAGPGTAGPGPIGPPGQEGVSVCFPGLSGHSHTYCAAYCPKGYTYYKRRGICFRAFNTPKTFTSADSTCYKDGGTLAMPKDRDTNAFLAALHTSVNDTAFFFFGLHDQREEGSFEWVDGSALGTYNSWKQGEPAGRGDCAVYAGLRWKGEWFARRCGRVRLFICQVAPGTSCKSIGQFTVSCSACCIEV